MNKHDAVKFLPLVQALADGKEIEYRVCGDNWRIKESIVFGGDIDDYRIKSEPIEIWCMVNSTGHCLSNQSSEDDCIETIEGLNRGHNNDFEDYKAVMFRQVLDESV